MNFTNIARKCRIVSDILCKSTLSYLLPFYQGHSYLTSEKLNEIRSLVGKNENKDVTLAFESTVAKCIGQGYAVSYASGRMGFYSILCNLNVGDGDEVILTGFTCSVMVNAVLRTGAKPIFADIDIETFGTDPKDVERKITSRTKVIVAQHSFGIPCKIKEIVSISARHNIFVIEDCAISYDSAIDGIKVGNWGDAAIFSTDHSKPINTLIGGFIYTKNIDLYMKLDELRTKLPFLDTSHQERIFARILKEIKYLKPEKYPQSFLNNILSDRQTFLDQDYTQQTNINSHYPYPAQMPPFLAQLGIAELEVWQDKRDRRKKMLTAYLDIIMEYKLEKCLPQAYFDITLDIVPLRFLMIHPQATLIKRRMSKRVDIGGTWFCDPIICCPDGVQSLGYSYGSCTTSELVCSQIINWPIIFESNYWQKQALSLFRSIFRQA